MGIMIGVILGYTILGSIAFSEDHQTQTYLGNSHKIQSNM